MTAPRTIPDYVRGVQIDAFLRREGVIRHDPQIVSGEGIPAYTELDLRAALRD